MRKGSDEIRRKRSSSQFIQALRCCAWCGKQRRKPLESFNDSNNVLNLWLLDRGCYTGTGVDKRGQFGRLLERIG